MRQHSTAKAVAWVCLLVGLVTAGCCPVAKLEPPRFATKDLSQFEVFRFWRGSGLGFCPSADSVLAASIERTGEGRYILRMKILSAEVDPRLAFLVEYPETCPIQVGLPDLVPLPCDELPERELGAEEVSRLREMFQRITFLDGPDPVCACFVRDPCLVNHFEWDGFELTNSFCGGYPHVTNRMAEIEVFVETLRQNTTPERPDPPDFGTCGLLIQGVECILLQGDDGAAYLLEEQGSFVPGDRVHVTGMLDARCVTVCLEGNGCIRNNSISQCPGPDPGP